ncbi:DUF421 domain-containing protein [Anaerobacillus sp. MEB173]|uniref:DUF421 domain-containing protein n=1 Tax=Anaerobacillus sp. MEB173 TaxID=3383345 RepID=UPI003F9197C0
MPGWLEVALRSFIALVVLLFATKLFVRKSLSQMTYFEYISGVVIGVIIGVVSFNLSIPIAFGVIALIIWLFVPYAIGFLAMKSKSVRNIVHGKGVPIIKDGKVLEDNLKKEKYNTDDLLKQLRHKNVFQVADVEFAVLENSGEINVLLKKENQPATPKDMQIPIAPIKEPETVIMDGKVLDEPLSTRGFNRAWLETELDKIGVAIENVYLGQIDAYGELTVDLFDDKIKVPQPQTKPLLMATIKKCQADLEMFALSTDSIQAKELYEKSSKDIQEVLNRVKPYLQ